MPDWWSNKSISRFGRERPLCLIHDARISLDRISSPPSSELLGRQDGSDLIFLLLDLVDAQSLTSALLRPFLLGLVVEEQHLVSALPLALVAQEALALSAAVVGTEVESDQNDDHTEEDHYVEAEFQREIVIGRIGQISVAKWRLVLVWHRIRICLVLLSIVDGEFFGDLSTSRPDGYENSILNNSRTIAAQTNSIVVTTCMLL